MSSREQALQFKQSGNTHFKAGEYEQAIEHFSKAIECDSTDHVFFSNRSACYASLEKYSEALADAEKCVALKPEWAKGYVRQGLALFRLNRHDEAKAVYEKGLTIDPENASLKEGLASLNQSAANPLAQLFGPSMWPKLQADPKTAEMLKDPSFVAKLKMIQTNPNALNMCLQDPELNAALMVLLGVPENMPGADGEQQMKDETTPEGKKRVYRSSNPYDNMNLGGDTASSADQSQKDAPETEEEKADRLEREEIAREKQEKAAKAEEEKAKGNDAYRAKKFDEALVHYDAAFAIDNTNPAYLNNKAAVYIAQKDFKSAAQVCDEAVKVGKMHQTKCQVMAKIYMRQGNAYVQMKDFANAVESYTNSNFEDKTDACTRALKKATAHKKKAEEDAYLDDAKSEAHKQAGNDFYKAGKWTEAIEEYSEALRRNPKNYKVYSNRANCYSKLMSWQQSLEDCTKCLELEPTFVKAYIRKAKTEHFLRRYHKAIETYDAGLKLDPNSSELIEGKRETMMRIQAENQQGEIDPQRRAQAMQDPEIQSILSDPQMMMMLQQMQSDPASAQKMMADPTIRSKVDKLVQAGVLQVR